MIRGVARLRRYYHVILQSACLPILIIISLVGSLSV